MKSSRFVRSNRFVRLAGALLAPLLIVAATVAQTGVASASDTWHGHNVLYVSKSARPWNSDRSCRSAAFRTIGAAVAAAPAGGTVIVCRGTYYEQVVISKPLTLVGKKAIIDQSGVTPTFQVTLPSIGTQTIYAGVIILSSRVTLTGFTVRNAEGEGVLAAGLGSTIYKVVISHNAVINNDLGFGTPPKSPYFLCASGGDCGEGIHFAGNIANSTIRDNLSADNSGGILITDDVGPDHNNLIEGNVVTGNVNDCGITVPGHNPDALNAEGVPQPQVAGVYDNVIKNNVVTDNGTIGEGAGVLFANETAGTASYDNLVEDNFISGNGLAGVTMHAHIIAPGLFEDLSGNVIVDNVIGENNLTGDTLDGPPGPSDQQTTGVLVYSGGTPVTVKIARNFIFNNEIGIWLSKVVTATGLNTNTFSNVTTPISGNH
jgi:hypothetical protein